MKKVVAFVLVLLCLSFLTTVVHTAEDASIGKIKERFSQKFPATKNIEEVRKTPISGLYEMSSPNMLLYYYPEKELLIFGEIWNQGGKSLTAERRTEIMAKKMKNLPLDKAVKIGNGKKKVVEFIDPECTYCKRVYQYLKDKDVTVYAFVLPLMGQSSEKKVKYLMCAADKEKAYHEIMTKAEIGMPDNCSIGNKKIDELRQFASAYGVTGVPFLLINGEPVHGANIQLINEKLDKGGK